MSIMHDGVGECAKEVRVNIEDLCRAGSWEREVTQMAVIDAGDQPSRGRNGNGFVTSVLPVCEGAA
jgi:hypothetical protein